ncbi:hypothetical protein JT358_08380 [Micrococcales bacterium 31B]|nr:hypothetical protein [Micrococcales bacterium 31B]
MQSLAVTIQVRLRDLAEWSVMDAAWQILGGEHRFEVGESAAVSAVGLHVKLEPAMLTD